MIIVLNGALKYYHNLSKAIIITRKPRNDIKAGRQIVISDILDLSVFSTHLSPKEIDVTSPYYTLAKNYLAPLKITDKTITVLINLSYGFDTGISLYLLEKFSRIQDLDEIIFIALIPRTNRTTLLARIYSWLIITSLYDIYFNMLREGLFKLIFVDEDNPPQLSTLLTELAEKKALSNTYSLLELRLQRYILPLIDLRILLKLTAHHGYLNSLLKEYRALLAVIHYVLDKAPSELWEIIRGEKYLQLLRSIKYRVDRINYNTENLELLIKRLVMNISRGSRYSKPIIDLKSLTKYLLSSTGLKEIYKNREIIEKIKNIIKNARYEELISVENVKKKYPSILPESFTKVVISKDLANVVQVDNDDYMIIEDYPNEVIILSYRQLPLCDNCSKEIYVRLPELRNSYLEEIYTIRYFFPERIYINDEGFTREEFQKCGLLNYIGYINAKLYDKLDFCENTLRKIEKATL